MRMTTTVQKFGFAILAVAGLALGTAEVANADNGLHRGWYKNHHGWRGHYAYSGNCFVRRTVHVNRFGERIVSKERICR